MRKCIDIKHLVLVFGAGWLASKEATTSKNTKMSRWPNKETQYKIYRAIFVTQMLDALIIWISSNKRSHYFNGKTCVYCTIRFGVTPLKISQLTKANPYENKSVHEAVLGTENPDDPLCPTRSKKKPPKKLKHPPTSGRQEEEVMLTCIFLLISQ